MTTCADIKRCDVCMCRERDAYVAMYVCMYVCTYVCTYCNQIFFMCAKN